MTNGKFLLSILTSGLISGVVAAAAVNNVNSYKDEQISLLNDQIDELTYIIDHNGHSYDCCCPECLAIIDQANTVQNVAFLAVNAAIGEKF